MLALLLAAHPVAARCVPANELPLERHLAGVFRAKNPVVAGIVRGGFAADGRPIDVLEATVVYAGPANRFYPMRSYKPNEDGEIIIAGETREKFSEPKGSRVLVALSPSPDGFIVSGCATDFLRRPDVRAALRARRG